jgi:RecA-family ATPase
MPPRPWLVPQLVPEDAMVCLYGAAGCGKTFLALDLGLALSSGLGQWQHIPFPKADSVGVACGVVYVAGEGINGIRDRVAAWTSKHNRTHAQIESTAISFIPQPVNLTSETAVREFADAVVQSQEASHGSKPVRLVIFDTLARCAVGADENSSQEMGVVVSNIDYIRRRISVSSKVGCTAILVHHCGKSNGSAMRGSSAIIGAMDTAMSLTPDPQSGTGAVVLKITKQKDGVESSSRHVLQVHDESVVVVPLEAAGTKRGRPGPFGHSHETHDGGFGGASGRSPQDNHLNPYKKFARQPK